MNQHPDPILIGRASRFFEILCCHGCCLAVNLPDSPYEFIRLPRPICDGSLCRAIVAPNLMLRGFTTREPDLDQFVWRFGNGTRANWEKRVRCRRKNDYLTIGVHSGTVTPSITPQPAPPPLNPVLTPSSPHVLRRERALILRLDVRRDRGRWRFESAATRLVPVIGALQHAEGRDAPSI